MAESKSSSSGEESSEEEEEDESASPSLRGATSPITAANRQTSREKRALFTERGYLDSLHELSRSEIRRIKREIRKGRKLALTVSNITSTLAGIDWRDIGLSVLYLPVSKCHEVSSQCSTDEERTAALVREWLLRDPLASWRRIIDNLYAQTYVTQGDSIAHYTEEQTDTSLTHSNLTKVLSSVDTDDLEDYLDIPESVSHRIICEYCDDGDDEKQQREQYVHYYITCSPYALMGWSHIAGLLHYLGKQTAERAAKDYVQRAPEPSLTFENLNTVMENISEGRLEDVVRKLHIPWSKRQEFQQQYPLVAQLKRAYSAYFSTHHPAPCWWIIARALYEEQELGALEMVQKLYVRDINLQNLCLEKLSKWLKSTSDIDTLPLPAKLKNRIKEHRLIVFH